MLEIMNTRTCDHSDFQRCITELETEIQATGMSIKICSDFEELRQACINLPGKAPVTDVFNPAMVDIGPHNGFWICGRDHLGRVVHLQAMRVDIIESNLADHWRTHGDKYRIPTHDVIQDQTDYEACPASRDIQGRVAYHGEFFISPGDNGFRKTGVHSSLSMLAVLLTTIKFGVDYTYGFITRQNVLRGLCAQFGYIHAFPYSIRWKLKDRVKLFDEFLVWITAEELTQLVHLSDQLEPNIVGAVSYANHDRHSVQVVHTH